MMSQPPWQNALQKCAASLRSPSLVESGKFVISILCPTRGRPEGLARLLDSLIKNTVYPERVELLCYLDDNDSRLPAYSVLLNNETGDYSKFKMVTTIVAPPIGIFRAWNELARISTGDMLIMAADDQTYNTSGWDRRLDEERAVCPDELFCMWFNDGYWGERLCTFPIVSRHWCKLLGYFVPPFFERLYGDLWIMDIAMRIGRLRYIPDVLTEHLHWSYGKAPIDATYEQQVDFSGNAKPVVQRDMDLFCLTSHYRETDARRLIAAMDEEEGKLLPGMHLKGRASIFED